SAWACKHPCRNRPRCRDASAHSALERVHDVSPATHQEAQPVLANVNGIPGHYPQHGRGTPVPALHGGGGDHREIEGALEPLFANRPGYRRIYPDLPGMGHTPAPERIDGNDAVLDLLLGLVDTVIGEEAFLLVGHSYGGYLARAIA